LVFGDESRAVSADADAKKDLEEIDMFSIGRVCVKLAGRDAGKKCIVIDVIDAHTVVVDGETRRRKCNVKHLEPLEKTVEISKDAPAEEVARAMKELGFGTKEHKKGKREHSQPKKARTRTRKEKPVKPAKPAAEKKAEKKEGEPKKKTRHKKKEKKA
jgi:large subunit ribosomal protein L14e